MGRAHATQNLGCVLKAGAGRQLWQGQSQSPKEALLPLSPAQCPCPQPGLGGPTSRDPIPSPPVSAVRPSEDLLPALPTHPDVDRGMAPAPALVGCLIAFKIMTMSVGWQGQ